MSSGESVVEILVGNPLWEGIRALSGILVRVMWDLNIPLDRARRVVLGTTLEHLEHVVRRIRGGNTSREPPLGGYSDLFGYFS